MAATSALLRTPGTTPRRQAPGRHAAALRSARRATHRLLAQVDDADLVRQFSPLLSPLVWDYAHIGYYEELWLLRELAGEQPLAADHDDLYDAFRHARAERGALPILDPRRARAYATDVRRRVLDLLERLGDGGSEPLLAGGFAVGLVVQHELQHVETMLQALSLAGLPLRTPAAPPARREPPLHEEVLVRGGPFLLGTTRSAEPWAYDNELDAHEIDLPPFWLDTTPVTNAAFLRFVEAGGYGERRHWSDEGWAWRTAEDVTAPLLWRHGRGGWLCERFGAPVPPAPHEPVQHVSWFEADAFARWAGKRLPTEAEWEKAATWHPAGRKLRLPWGDAPPAGRANLGRRRLGPAPAGAFSAGASPWGAEQLLGDVWEWTSSTFAPYPGFEAFPYREYSEAFFGAGHRVLRGGSWATDPVVARPTFRNWDLPQRRQLFAGFRCARDV